MAEAKNSRLDVVIVDTAGRLHVDDELMDELQTIKAAGDLRANESVVHAIRPEHHDRPGRKRR